MPLVGNLRDYALHDFLYLVERGYKTGSLLLQRDDDGAALYFDRGKLISVARPHRRERLGELLLRLEKVTPAMLDRATALQKNGDNRPLGTILVEVGAISKADLQSLIQHQIEDTVYDLFAWHEGEFKFEADALPAFDDVQALTPILIENLIMEGVRRVDEMSRIRERIPGNDMIVVLTNRANQKNDHINMTVDEWRVFARINGKTSIADIAQKTGLSSFDVSHVVYGLLTTGMAEVRKPPPLPQIPALPAVAIAESRMDAAVAIGEPEGKRGLVGRLIERIRGI
ncbi:MAG: DUF4388 domain-containing protein [Herpetosiphon sp.]